MQWNLRDVFRSKTRSLMAITGVIGCMALLITAFGLRDSFNDIITWQYSDLVRYESKLSLEETITKDEIDTIKEDVSGELLMETSVELKAGDIKKTGDMLAYDTLTLMTFTDPQRSEITLPDDGISISYKMAEVLGIKEGDSIQWHIYGEEGWKTSVISAIYRTPVAQGITLSKSVLEDLGYTFSPTAVITAETIAKSPDGVVSTLSVQSQIDSFEVMVEAMYIMIYVLIIAACLLAIVVLYNLGILSFTERNRELATLKLLGFKSQKIRKLLLTQSTVLSIVGILIGMPAGYYLLYFMIQTVSDSYDMMTIVTPFTYIISILISLLLSIGVNMLFSRHVKKIDMVSSLKGVE